MDSVQREGVIAMTSSTLSQREMEIIELLARAFPQMHLEARRVNVHNLEGGEVSTLRFTLHDTYSADLETQRIENSNEPLDVLAGEVENILRQQI
jgi:hypothetical protein